MTKSLVNVSWLLLVLTILSTIYITSAKSKGCFRAASYEHILVGYHKNVRRDNPLKYIRENLKAFSIAAETAAGENADIIVFMEEGLSAAVRVKNEVNSTKREGMALISEDIPNPNENDEPIIPCIDHEFKSREILRTLSCIARKNSIYLVTVVGDKKNCSNNNDTNCPEDGIYLYNTQVAFDRKGTLIARYHKYHLYGEFHFNVPDEINYSYFDTDFGARIGMHICFDRLFHDPWVTLVEKYNVTTMALSTWFFDEYPFLVSHQIDQSQAIALGINIVSANSKRLETGTTGSGIFSPKYVAISEHDVGKNKEFTRPRVLIGNLPVDPKSSVHCDPDPWTIGISKFKVRPGMEYKSFYTNFSAYTSTELTDERNDNVTVCHGEFCCNLQYEFKKSGKKQAKNEARYFFAVTDRFRTGYYESQYPTYEQVCLLVAYDSESNTYPMNGARRFKWLNIRASFDTNYVYPAALSNDFDLLDTRSLKFKVNENDHQLKVKSKRPVLMAGLYGRIYDRDPPYKQYDFGNSSHANNVITGA